MLTEYLNTDMRLAWDEWHRDQGVETPPPIIHTSYQQGYQSGVATLRWLLQEARPTLMQAGPNAALDRLLERLESVGA